MKSSMTTLVRHFLVLAAFVFWQGGFTFYSGVVVPLGQKTLGPAEQGFLTGQVTNYLNLAGGASLVLLAWDLAASCDPSKARRRGLWLAWTGMALSLAVLLALHLRLDGLLDAESMQVLERRLFRTTHRWYLRVSTFQWVCALTCLAILLWSWREADQLASSGGGLAKEQPEGHRGKRDA